jgi:hypothetical protein
MHACILVLDWCFQCRWSLCFIVSSQYLWLLGFSAGRVEDFGFR